MPVSPAVRRLGGRWQMVVERATAFAEQMPKAGISLAAFGALALADVDASDIGAITKALAGKRVVWLRRIRGEVRVFAQRPETIAGLISGLNPSEACLSDAAPHLCGVTRTLFERERAKEAGDFVAADAARDQLDVLCGKVVDVVRRHVARGLLLAAFRETLWANWAAVTLDAVAIFEPALARKNNAGLSTAEPARAAKRICSGLSDREKVAALVSKASAEGVTKTFLYQRIRPKPNAGELSLMLDGLVADGRIRRHRSARGERYVPADEQQERAA